MTWKKISIAAYNNKELKKELLKRVKRDQDIRIEHINSTDSNKDEVFGQRMMEIDNDNTQWLRGHVDKHGFPGASAVGENAAEAAYLIAQHSQDNDFRATALEHMKKAEPGEHKPSNIATMEDRVLVDRGEPQLYGTQYRQENGQNISNLIKDPEKVDERRKEMGMGTLKEYMDSAP